MSRALLAAAAVLLSLTACDSSTKDRLSDEQAEAPSVGPQTENLSENFAEGAEGAGNALDAASNEALDKPDMAEADDAAPKLDPNGPSFQCAGLLNRVEEMICTDPELARRDRQVAANYAKALKQASPEQKDRLQTIGRRYLVDRNRCEDTDCVLQAYLWYSRDIDTLMGWPTSL